MMLCFVFDETQTITEKKKETYAGYIYQVDGKVGFSCILKKEQLLVFGSIHLALSPDLFSEYLSIKSLTTECCCHHHVPLWEWCAQGYL